MSALKRIAVVRFDDIDADFRQRQQTRMKKRSASEGLRPDIGPSAKRFSRP